MGIAARPGFAAADPLSVDQFGQMALRCGPDVAPSTLASIARTESRFQPLTINDNTIRVEGVPATRAVAVQIATRLLEAGHSVDLGVMQINSRNFTRLGLTPDTAFDPCRSIAAASAILVGAYTGGVNHGAEQSALRAAISDYNTGSPLLGFENGYVHKVELAARTIVPALDVSSVPAPVDTKPLSPPAASTPEATAPVDVWAAFDRQAAPADGRPHNEPVPGDEPGLLVNADQGGTAFVDLVSPTIER